MGATHIVPLSAQAVEILVDLQPITGAGRFLFPSLSLGRRRSKSDLSIHGTARIEGDDREAREEKSARQVNSKIEKQEPLLGQAERVATERYLSHSSKDSTSGRSGFVSLTRRLSGAGTFYQHVREEAIRSYLQRQFQRAFPAELAGMGITDRTIDDLLKAHDRIGIASP